MKVLRQAYGGFCGFKGGELDLQAVPPGLVAFSGPNWAGKTTLLELPLAGWYREWASRATDNIADWADTRESWIEIDFEVGPHVYRSRVNVDGVNRKQQAVLSQYLDGRWKPLTDGNVSTYDAAIEKLLPPKKALLCSQFSAQNFAGSLSNASKSERKDLFVHFLWLDQMIAMSDVAKTCMGCADLSLERVRAKIDVLSKTATAEREQALIASITELEDAIDAMAETSGLDFVRLRGMMAQRDQLQESVDAYLADLNTRQEAERRMAMLRTSRALLESTLENLSSLRASRVAQAEQTRTQNITSADTSIASLEHILALREDIDAAVEKLARHEARIDELNRLIDAVPPQLETLKQLARDIEAAALINNVPCHGQSEYAGCQFLSQAVQARDRVRAGASTESVAEEIQALRDHGNTMLEERASLRGKLKALRDTANQRFTLQSAEVRIAELQQQKIDAQRRYDATVEQIDDEIAAKRTETEAALATAAIDIENLNVELLALTVLVERNSGALQEKAALDAEVAALDKSLAEARLHLDRKSAELTQRRADLDAVQVSRREVARLSAAAVAIDRERQVQQFLAKALSRDGLPTLEIAAAAPAISQLTTDLLEHSGFGARFRVEVTTLVPTADGKGWKEDFAIRVYDNERGKEIKDVGDLSGGERVLFEEALRAALTIFVTGRHAHPMKTCWRDETTGPLNRENRGRYLAMLRRLRELGGYDHVILVSHADDAKAASDTIIDVEAGRPRIRTA